MKVDPNRPFQHLCPEADLRDQMDDGEFWDHVFPARPEDDDWPDPEDFGPDIPVPCPVCGDTGACGYDEDGRPWIHVIGASEDDE